MVSSSPSARPADHPSARPTPRFPGGKARARIGLTLFVLPAALLYALFVLWPLVNLSILSLERWDGYTSPVFVGLQNYTGLGADPGFVQEAQHTVLWLVVTLTVPVGLGLVLALLLRLTPPAMRAVARALLLVPLLLPTVLIAVAWRLFYNPLSGPLTSLLQDLRLSGLAGDWLGDPGIALRSLLVVACWASFGLSMVICEAALGGISPDLVAAAQLDGAGAGAIFRTITLPALRGVLPLAMVATALCAVPAYDLIALMTNGGPGYATTTLSLDAYGRAFGGMGQIGVGAALACLQALVGMGLALIALAIARGYERGEGHGWEETPLPRRGRSSGWAAATLIVTAFIILAPLVWLVVLAFRPAPGSRFLAGLGANLGAIGEQGFVGAIATSLEMASVVAVVTAVLALPAAFAIAGGRRVVRRLAAVLLAIGLFQPLAVLIIPLFSLLEHLGLLNTAAGVMAPEAARVVPLAVLLLWIGVRSLPSGVLEAAATDGAAPRQILYFVVLPLLGPLMMVILAWSFLVSWNDYLVPTVVIQDDSLITVPTALAHFVGRFDTEYGLLAGGALLALLPIAGLYAGLYRVLARGARLLGRNM